MIEGVFEVEPDANVRVIDGKVFILPDPNAPPGDWTPFDAEGRIDHERLEVEGWRVVTPLVEGE